MTKYVYSYKYKNKKRKNNKFYKKTRLTKLR